MKIVSLNVGKRKEQPWRDGTLTAIHKQAINEKLWVSESGLDGDEHADLKNHGGVDKAILVLPSNAYMRFEIEHPYGFLGENLTIDDIDEAEICIGDRLQIGSVLLEVTQPRSPCWKLDAQVSEDSKWQARGFLKAYSNSGRVGFYCRVLAEGWLEKGLSVRWLTRNEEDETYPKISVQSLFLAKLNHSDNQVWQVLQSAVQHPALSTAWKDDLQGLLDRHSSQSRT